MNKQIKIQRFPTSSNKSLKAFSAADEHVVKMASEELLPHSTVAIFNDRFGFLSLSLIADQPTIFTHHKSQEDAIVQNYALNNLDTDALEFRHLLDDEEVKVDIIILKIPKSMDLFHLFMTQARRISQSNTKVYCGFMTRHFTKQMLEISSHYFENVDQSLAWKKSRVLVVSTPRDHIENILPIKTIPFVNHRGEDLIFKQYYGVFSGKHIDYATQFLLANLKIEAKVNKVLDLASGNGVIAHEVRSQAGSAEIHLLDDSYLAIESSKMNLTEGDNHFHYNHHLNDFEDHYFDLVICNPPFHFEHENTIDIALELFKGVARILKKDGAFILVANLHLNYKTHLSRYFSEISILNTNEKFEIFYCQKVFSYI